MSTESSATETSEGSLLILGLGNPICSDDGLGVVAVDRIQRRYELPRGARALDGGTHGMSLLNEFEGVDDVILVDAVASDSPPGTCLRVEGETVMAAVRERESSHQVGISDLLDALRFTDSLPRRLVLLGIVPRTDELGLGLSPEVEAELDALVRAVVDEADRMGYALRRRTGNEEPAGGSSDPAIRAVDP